MYQKLILNLKGSVSFLVCVIVSVAAVAQVQVPLELTVAAYNLKGYNFTNAPQLNERLCQSFKIKYNKNAPRTIVLGSSRALHLDSRSLNDNRLQNNWLSGCTIEDMLAMYSFYLAKGMKPARVIIGVDPWLFNSENEQPRWQAVKEEYLTMSAFLHGEIEQIPPYSPDTLVDSLKIYNPADYDYKPEDFDTVSIANMNLDQLYKDLSIRIDSSKTRYNVINDLIRYPALFDSVKAKFDGDFTASIQSLDEETRIYRGKLFSGLAEHEKANISKLNRLILLVAYNLPDNQLCEAFPTLADTAQNSLTYFPDGGVSYAESFRNQLPAAVEAGALNYLNYSVLNFRTLDSARTALFNLFVNYLIANDIQVIFYLSPYHPKIYNAYTSHPDYERILEVEKLIKERVKASRKQTMLVGSYDPAVYRLNSSHFYDGMHIKRQGLNMIIRKHSRLKLSRRK
jgi:hypothetical protein